MPSSTLPPQTLQEVVITPPIISDYRVSLARAASVNSLERVVFTTTPSLREERQVDYKPISPVQAPGEIYQYAYTRSRTFSIEAKLVSRSVNEATRNLTYIQYLRSWAMPVFGTVKGNASVGEKTLGTPPAVLFLTAYSTGKPKSGQQDKSVTTPALGTGEYTNPSYGSNLYKIPVIITHLSIPFPEDVDYIPTLNNYPIPMITTVSISLAETHSPNKYSSFNLQDFKNGTLINF